MDCLEQKKTIVLLINDTKQEVCKCIKWFEKQTNSTKHTRNAQLVHTMVNKNI